MMRSLFFYISVFRNSIVLYLVYDVIIKAVKTVKICKIAAAS